LKKLVEKCSFDYPGKIKSGDHMKMNKEVQCKRLKENLIDITANKNNRTIITHEDAHDLALLIDILQPRLSELRKKLPQT